MTLRSSALTQAGSTGDPLDVGSDEKLLAALNAKPLAAWATELEAIPTRIRQAREEAARRIAPQAVHVRPPSTTLRTEAEAEAYVAGHEARAIEAISPQRRQELALGIAGAALAGALAGGVAVVRARHRRAG